MPDRETRAPLWTPSADLLRACNLTEFAAGLRASRGLDFGDYHALWRWSVSDLEGFWSAVWEYFGLDSVSGYDRVLESVAMPGARWFPGAMVNFAGQLLSAGEAEDTAIVSVDETGRAVAYTRRELRLQSAALARNLSEAGVGVGDVVAGYVSNRAESVIAMLAAASIGAIWSSVGLDYAPKAVIDRFAQLTPKALIAADGYHFGGRWHERGAAIGEVRQALSESLLLTVVVSSADSPLRVTGASQWSTVTADRGVAISPALPVAFEHPLWVLFSSGTTGVPKGLVHSHGGILVEMLKQMGLHWNLDRTDRVFWYTSPSWVMWNLQLSTLLLGGSILCYDGSPTYPDVSALWGLVAEHGVTFFGASPGYLRASEKAGIVPAEHFDLTRLRAMGSTGSPLSPELHRWAFDRVGALPLWSMSGGTDIAGAFCGGAPIVDIWPGELSCRCLGVAVDSWDPEGQSLIDEVGELVITQPMPSMPVALWNDPSGRRYRDAYFEMFDHAWRQGDWVTITGRGSVVIHGRSDSTLNRKGVRMGTGEIYAAVEGLAQIAEALIIGVEYPDGTYWMPLFLVLAEGVALDGTLVKAIRTVIGRDVSARHVPDEMIVVSGIPHTRTGKKLEVPIKRLFQGADLEAVVTADAVDDFHHLEVFHELAQRRIRGSAEPLGGPQSTSTS